MEEEPPVQARPRLRSRPPGTGNPAAGKAPARKPGQPTAQQKLIGYGVLAAGVLAVLVVGWIALSRTKGPETSPVTQAAVQDSKAQPPAVATESRKPKTEKIGRISGISEKQIEGTWSSEFGDMQAIFHLADGTYQILAARPEGSPSHYYSRGTYTLEDDLLTLTPVGAMGAPKSDDPKVRYARLAGRPFSVAAGMTDGRQVWLPGPADPNFPNRTTLHPLIRMSGGEMVVWTRSKD